MIGSSFAVRGIDGSNASALKTAINDYKNGVDGVLNQIVALDVDRYQQAMKGNTQITTIKAYVDNSVAEMKRLSSYIDQFSEAVNRVLINYGNQSSSFKTSEVESLEIKNADDLTGVKAFSEGGGNSAN